MMRVTTMYNYCEGRLYRPLLLLLAFILTAGSLSAMTDRYQLAATTGSPTDMRGSTQIYGTCNHYYYASSMVNIGFDFYFDGTRYTNFSVSPAGHMSLGRQAGTYYYSPRFPEYSGGMRYPMIAPAYFSYGGTGQTGKVHYKVTGTAPNRVLTVEWKNIYYYYYCYSSSSSYTSRFHGTFQARLYEGTDRIEFWYGDMYESPSYSYYTAIGIAASSSRYISLYDNQFPNHYYANGSSPTYNYRQLSSYPISENTVYSFTPCQRSLEITGNLNEGGTADMDPGDDLMTEETVQRGSSQAFTPINLTNLSNGCSDVSYSVSITGPDASDYSVSNGTVRVGETVMPQIQYTPSAIGTSEATATFSMSSGQKISYDLRASGTPRIRWVGDIAEGGTSGMSDQDQLLTNIDVERTGENELNPFTLENFNRDPGSGQAEISYILDDPYDQYEIRLPGQTGAGTPTSESLMDYVGSGESSTLGIVFHPTPAGMEHGTGPQEAHLTVIADGEVRNFILNGFSVAPAAEWTIEETRVIGSDRNFFRGIVTCVGVEATTLQLEIENINKVDFVINSLQEFELDSRIQNSGSRYPIAVDMYGRLVESQDYILTEAPGVAPTTANERSTFPLTVAPGEKRTFYLTFVAQRPGKRYTRLFFNTNAVNFLSDGIDNYVPGRTPGPEMEGIMSLDFFARGVGGDLALNSEGDLDGLALTFDPVKVGESIDTEVEIFNSGDCDLRISKDDMKFSTGDVNEFELIEVFNGIPVDGADYVIPPHSSATVKARFTPNRSGSRRASIMLRTSDSTTIIDGITERGVYYLNAYGFGRAELQVRDLTIEPAVIDGPGSTGKLEIVNASTEVIDITNVALSGPDIAEIVEDPASPWPAMPVQLEPGKSLELGVALMPTAGSQPGPRTVNVDISYGDADMVSGTITGLAGTRQLVATPPSLFDGVSLPVGSILRKTAVISNSGTFPVLINDIRIEGTGATEYTLNKPERLMIAPGGFEFIEVVYAPTQTGNADAKIVIASSSTAGDLEITLNGSSAGTTPVGGGSSNGMQGAPGNGAERSSAAGSFELSLGRSIPNPAAGSAEIMVVLGEGTSTLGLYDAQGRLVRSIETAGLEAGPQRLPVDLQGLPSGLYIFRLQQNGKSLTRSVTVVK